MATKKRKADEETVSVGDVVITTPDHAAELEARLKAKQDEHLAATAASTCAVCGSEVSGSRCEVDGSQQ